MISAVVLTKNEEKNIEECLKTLSWCDEIVVVDDYSEDKTVEITRKYGAKVFQRELGDDFSKQRNFGLDKARGEWILFVDADERISEALASEIKSRVTSDESPSLAGFYLKRTDFIWGRELKHGETGNIRLLRLAKKNAGRWQRRVHETWEVGGPTVMLHHPLLHYPHQTLREFITDIDKFSTLHARANFEEGKRSNLLKIIFWQRLKFFQNFILKRGFLDGGPGFMVAMLMSFHSFLAWSKLWLRQKSKL